MSKTYRHFRRNFVLFIIDYVAFGVAFSLISTSGTVVPSFVSQLTDSKQIIGLAGSLYLALWLLPQLLLAQVVNRRARRKPFVLPAVFFRMVMIGLAILIGSWGAENPMLTLSLFLVGYWLFAAGDSVVTLAWGDLLGGGIPNHLRGMMFGIGQFFVAGGALLMRELAGWALGPDAPPFPQNYAFLFGVAGVIFVIGGISLALIKEETGDQPHPPGPALREFAPYLGSILRTDRQFRLFIRTRLLYDLGTMAVPFYVIFGIQSLGLLRSQVVPDSILLIQIGSAIASILMGVISRRSGSRAVMLIAGICLLLESVMALAAALSGSYLALYATLVFLGMVGALAIPGYFDWMITHAPPDRRPIYIGLTNTISAFSNLAPVLGGTLLQSVTIAVLPSTSGIIPPFLQIPSATLTAFPVVFLAAALMASLGLFSATRLYEPRTRSNQP